MLFEFSVDILEDINKYNTILFTEKEPNRLKVYIKENKLDYEKFRNLKRELENKGYLIFAKSDEKFKSEIYFLIYRIEKEYKKHQKIEMFPPFLLLITSLTLFLAGYFLFNNKILLATIYMFAVLTILALHEFGHYIVAKFHKLKISLPYFIPAPFIGTFGAIIKLREPFIDRLQRFDVGISGPLLGLLPTLIFGIIGLNFSLVYEEKVFLKEETFLEISNLLPFIYYLIIKLQLGTNSLVILHPLAFASFLGFLITFLNMSPIGQLDGGHVVNSYFKKGLFSLIGLIVLFLSGFVLMAILALFLLFLKIEPLNTVTELDKKRKIYAILFIILWIILIPVNVWALFLPLDIPQIKLFE